MEKLTGFILEKNCTVIDSLVSTHLTHRGWQSVPASGNLSLQHDEDCAYRLLQPLWSIALRYSYYTSSALFPVVISVVAFFICQVVFTAMDLLAMVWPAMEKYRIQSEVEYTWTKLQPALITTFWNHVIYIMPASMAQWAWTPETEMPELAPSLWEFCWHQYLALIIMDTEFYLWHMLHHKNRFLYRHVHSIHHRYTAVNSWATQYVHPWELFSIGLMATTSPWWLKAHPMTCWSFMAFVLAISVDEHCGYDLPIMPHHWAPFWGGSRKHDMHHQRPLTNFQPYFNWFDRLFGSECTEFSKSKSKTSTKIH